MIALDPNQTFGLTLDIEAAKPEDRRRKFACRFLTARQVLEVAEARKKIMALPDDEDSSEKIVAGLEEALAIGIAEAGLRNQLTAGEMWELLYKMPRESRLQETERKKSALQQASAAAAKSAPVAQPAAV